MCNTVRILILYIRRCVYVCTCVYLYVYMCVYVYVCVGVYVQIHMYILRSGFSSLSFLFFSVYLILAYLLFPWKWMFRHLSLPVPGPELGSM